MNYFLRLVRCTPSPLLSYSGRSRRISVCRLLHLAALLMLLGVVVCSEHTQTAQFTQNGGGAIATSIQVLLGNYSERSPAVLTTNLEECQFLHSGWR